MENSSTTNPAVFRSNRGRNLQLVGERTAEAPSDIAAREHALEAKEAQLQAALTTLETAFSILGARALVIVTATGAIGAFGWALYMPAALTLSAACLYSCLVFLPALWVARQS
mgnify:CR=1 FL=1